MLPPLILYTQVLLLHSLVEEEQRGDHTGCNEIHLKNTNFMDLLCSDSFCKGITYGLSAHRTRELKLIDGDITVLGQQFLLLLPVGLLESQA